MEVGLNTDEARAVRVFTGKKVMRLTGLSPRQLQYWDEQGFLSPSIKRRSGRGHRRLYSFRDLVALRVAADLRTNGVPLQQIRKVAAHLETLDYQNPLAEVRFWSVAGVLFFEESETVRWSRRPDQTVAQYPVPVGAIVAELDARIGDMDKREVGRIERRRGKLGSKPVIAGTRIPTASIWRLAQDGADEDGIRELYPDLTSEDIQAALAEEQRSRPQAL